MTNQKQSTNKAETKTAEVAVTQTESSKIWNEIKNKPLNMFALQGMTVGKYCKPKELDPNRCFLQYTATAAIPAVEEAVKDKYDFEVAGQYIIVSRKK